MRLLPKSMPLLFECGFLYKIYRWRFFGCGDRASGGRRLINGRSAKQHLEVFMMEWMSQLPRGEVVLRALGLLLLCGVLRRCPT